MATPTIDIGIMQKPDYYGIVWLKRVTGFNPKNHCVRSLRGSYSPVLPGKGEREVDVAYSGSEDATKFDFLYLCGVHTSYDLALNLHVPMRYAAGKVFKVDDDGITATFVNAERLIVPGLPDTFDLTDDEAFTRCRNYQFAYNAYARDPAVIVLADDPGVELSDWVADSVREHSTQGELF